MNIKEKLTIAEKRREEVIGKVVETAREETRKAEIVRQNKARLQVLACFVKLLLGLFLCLLAGGGKSRYYSKGAGMKFILSLES